MLVRAGERSSKTLAGTHDDRPFGKSPRRHGVSEKTVPPPPAPPRDVVP